MSQISAAPQNGTIDNSGNAGYGPSNYTICNYSAKFDSLFGLNVAIAESGLANATGPFVGGGIGSIFSNLTVRSDCIAVYTLQALLATMDTAYNNYTVVNDGYDKEFGYYITYMEKIVPEVIDGVVMFDAANASAAESMAPVGPGMQYFDCKIEGSDSTFTCSDAPHHMPDMGYKPTTMTLKDGMGDEFNATLVKAGITPDWVYFGDHTITHDQTFSRAGRNWQFQFHGFPVAKANMDIANPKDIVTKALPSIPSLRIQMQASLLDIVVGNWPGGSTMDVAEAYSTPVFLLEQAVENMAEAKKLGEKEQAQEEEARKNFIVMIISVVLMFVPVVGEEVATAAGLASLARAIAIAGEVGNSALGIYDSVNNPSSAVINVLGMLIGVGAISKVSRDGQGLSKVGKIARTMTPDTVAKFGSVFKSEAAQLNDALKTCKWA